MAIAEMASSDSSFDTVGRAFMRHLQLREFRPGTLKQYSWALSRLFTFLEAAGVHDLADVTREQLEAWQLAMLDSAMKASSRSNASSATKALLRWAARADIVDWRLELAIYPVKVRKKKRRPIPREDLMKILAWVLSPHRGRRGIVDRRDGALFVYLLVTSSRVDAALHVRRDEYVAPIVVVKGGNEKQLNTTPTALDLVVEYLRERRDDSPWLWIKHGNNRRAEGDRLEASGVLEAWKRLALQLQIKPFNTHQVRHTSATFMANRRLPVVAIKERLGHVKLETTMGYIEVDEDMQRDADAAFEDLLRGAAPARPLPRARRGWSDYLGR